MKNNSIDIIKEAAEKGIKLVVNKGSLSLKTNSENIDPVLLQKIKNNKQSIIQYFEKYEGRNKITSIENISPFNRSENIKIPLSFSQERLWFLDQLQGSADYHIPVVLRLEGKLDISVLETTFKTIVNRHEVLRTVIYSEDGVGYQKINSSKNWSLKINELKSNEELLDEELQNFLNLPFNLGTDYMFRACLYSLGSDDYVLACVFHHIASDGWSQDILISEFEELYSALLEKREARLPDLTLQYSDYAMWQRKYVDGEVLKNQLSYWENNLKGTESLNLPLDYARPSIQNTKGATVEVTLEKELSGDLSLFCKKQETTMFMVLLATFKVLLARYSGQDDICVGTPVANRVQSDLEGMIGFFVNTLALRSDLSKEPSFNEFLKAVKETTIEGQDNQLVPFEKVVSLVENTRDVSKNPLFQAMFVLQDGSKETTTELNGLTLSNYEYKELNTPFDITLNVAQQNEEIVLSLAYCTALFKESTIKRMIDHYQKLLKNVLHNPDQKVNSIPILTRDEEQQLLNDFNNTFEPFPQNETIVSLFNKQVEATPNSLAIVFEEKSLTFKELDEKSNQLAQYLLTTHGINKEDFVGVKLERSDKLIIALFGILKSGGVYVPIDPNYPQERINYIESDSNCSVIIDEAFLEDFKENEANYSLSNPEIEINSNQLAYIIYTSGSTGKPKGVMIEHKGIINTVFAQINAFDVDLKSNCLQYANQCFDASISEILVSVLAGSALYIISENKKLDVRYFTDYISNNKISVATLPPAFVKLLDVNILKGLKTLITAGEQAPYNEALAYVNNGGNYINAYGPTETSICATIFNGNFESSIPIGKPIANAKTYILDKFDQILPVGIIGELCVGGAGLAKGYLNKEELTKEKFVENPFVKGERLYKTGDLAKWLPDGNIEFVGRIDDQVKIRGYRVELGEIESELAACNFVKQCCVLAKPDKLGTNRLVGYIVPKGEFNSLEVEEFLKENLPDYMVPQLWVELDEIPLTNNGKVDKKALLKLDVAVVSKQEYVAPRTEIETTLALIWQELLELDKVGVHDNFFELGGHSLLIVQLMARIQKENYQVTIQEIFSNPTISQLAGKLKAKLTETNYQIPVNGITDDCVYIEPSMVPLIDFDQEMLDNIMSQVQGGGANIQDIYPLAPLQEGIYFHHLMSRKETGDVYVTPTLLAFQDKVKRTRFVEALDFVINRHDVLRTCILNEGLPHAVQVVLKQVRLETKEVSLKGEKVILEELKELVESGNHWLDLTKAPMIQIETADDIEKGEYYLLFKQHHTVLDHVGLEKIVDEIITYLSGEETNLPTPVLYRNFIAHTLHQQNINNSESYFRSRLEDIEEPTLPFGLQDVKGDGSQIEECSITLSDTLSRSIRDTASALGMSPATIFHAAWGIVIGTCSSKNKVAFGTILSGRLQGAEGSDQSLGLFINTLPIVLDLETSIPNYINKVNDELLGLLSYEQTPLTDVQGWSGLDRRVPLFSGVLNYRHSNVSEEADDDYGITMIGGKERTNYPFGLSVDDYGDKVGFGLTAQVDTSLNADRIVSYMEKALFQLLEKVNSEETEAISISIISDDEHNMLKSFNGIEISYPQKTLVALLQDQVNKKSNEKAVVFEGEILTYKELDEKSNRLANYLLSHGIELEDLVGVKIERSEWLVIALFGILKSGGVYVPIDPNYPQDRIDYIEKDSNCKVIIDEVFLNDFKSKELEYSSSHPEVKISIENLAYVIYTSGSTGKPKGVLIEHKGIVNTIKSQITTFKIDRNSNCLQFANQCFDASVWEILLSTIAGATLHVIAEDKKSDLDYFISFIEKNKITNAILPPAFLKLLDINKLKGLDTLITGGEQAPLEKALEFSRQGGVYFNAYGPTETSICATTFNGKFTNSIPIGKPTANTSIYILNNSQELVPIGVTGELCIGGAGLARGYLNKEELTKEKFILNPLVKGERLYRTGDLAKWLPDGNLEFIGRADDQVKIRGYRVELGEIENSLILHTDVQSCCVLAKSDTLGNKRLVGYIASKSIIKTQEIEHYLKGKLPEYMVPNIWVILDEIPVTSSGKVDKKSLPDPDISSLAKNEYIAPQTKLEIELTKIWEELLGVEKIGLNDNFFELGGHSLSATRLVSMMRKELVVEVSIRDVFAHATIGELSTHLSGLSSSNLLPSIVKQEKDNYIPLSFSQERLWFLDQLQGSVEYHIPVVLRLKGSLDVNILEQSLKKIVERHEILRTVVYSKEGFGYQKVKKSENWKLKVKEVHSNNISEEEFNEFLIQPFDLSSDYMMRACLYNLSEDDFVLACVFHHIASDGWSQGILISEFTEIYKTLVLGEKVNLPDLTLQYADYAIWQQEYVKGKVLNNQLSYWENKLKNTPPLALPTDYLRPSVQSTEGTIINFALDKELSDSVLELCKQEETTLFMTLLAAFKVLLSRYSGQTDICVGTPIANRTQSEVEGMIGFFVNTLALRSDLSQNPTFKEVLRQVRETTLEGYDHQLTPFEKVVDRVADNRDMSITPLFQVMFALQNTPEDITNNDELEGLKIAPYEYKITTSQFDLSLTADESEEGLLLNMEYCTALFKESTIRRMLTHYKELLVSLVKDSTQNIRSISILTEHEEKELLYDFNNTEVAYPLDKTTVDLFREQVEKTPDSVALIFGNDQLSYKELDEKSNQLARYLNDQGVGEDVLVALCIERSLEMIVGILGILKAGGAYVPIKPDYPEARISHILSDIKGDIVLTDELSAKSLDVLTDIRIIELESVNSPYLEYSTDSIETNLSPSSLGYVIYTSGSTGVPKGAMIEHSGLLNHLLIMIDELSMTTESVVAFTAPFTFDISVWQMLSGLLSGGKVVIYSEEQILDPSSLQESLYDHNVSHLQLVPSYVSGLLDTSSEKSLEKLSYFLVTGEATQHSLLSRWFSRYPNIPVVNAYGPAEASDDVSLHIMHELPTGSTVPVGKPVANMHIYVVDSSGNLCPKGIVGEIWVSGIGVGRGYVNDLEKTTKSFIANPFIPSLGKVYKTGDLGRWLSDGTLEFVGRSDDQVKIRGYRIELGEIEGVLSSFETVESCCVLAKEDGSGNNRLVGYLVSEGEFNKQEIQEYLKDRLPEYMVPQLWVELEDMPLTNNGKIDKKALLRLEMTLESGQEYVAPRTETETTLALIWQDLLDVDKVGIYDNFFEFGGHSLMVVQLMARMQKENYQVTVKEIFSNPTIHQLAGKLKTKSTEINYQVPPNGITDGCTYVEPSMLPLINFDQEMLDSIMNRVEGGASNIQDIYPLAPLQEGIYFHHLMSDKKTGDVYVDSTLLSFQNKIKRTRFIEALNFVIDRHDVLRTCILSEGLPHAVQIVLKKVELNVQEIALEGKKEVLEELKDLVESGSHWIDLTKAPMIQIETADDIEKGGYYLIFKQHHTVLDHVGLEKIINEIMMFLSGEEANLPTPVLYRNFIAHTLHQQNVNDSESYFRSRFEEIEEPTLPFGLQDIQGDGSQIKEHSITLPDTLSESIRDTASALRISPAVIFHAAWGLVIGSCSSKDKVVFGTILSGRLQGAEGSDQSLGLFINTLPIVLDLEKSIPDYINQVNDELLGLLSYEQTPLTDVQGWSGLDRRVPLFSAVLNYRHSQVSDDVEDNFGIEVIQAQERTNYPFGLSVDDLGEENGFGLTAQIDGSIDPLRIISYVENILNYLIEELSSQDVKATDLTVISDEEYDLLNSFNDTEVSLPEKTLVDLFKDQIKNSSSNTALVYEEVYLTYKELDEKSNRLANYLLSHGIEVEDLVGVKIERNEWLIIALLGVLKSGGVYVPIDPNYPQDRIDYIEEDSNCKVIIDDLFLNDFKLKELDYSSSYPEVTIRPEHLAYVIYTSGSTGKPKGVMIEHGGIRNTLLSQIANFSIDTNDNCLQFASPSFDASIWEIGIALLSGASLCIVSEEGKSDVSLFKKFIEEQTITFATLPPAFLQLLEIEDIPTIKTLVTAGEAIPLKLAKTFSENYNYVNAYGPTETSICTTTFNGEFINSVPIGKPIANTTVYLLNNEKLVPMGVIGELCVGGAGLARGYLNKEELTKEKFITTPFVPGERLYRTGDLAKWLPDGNLQFIGRVDDQVKIRGYRVELGEIENLLSLHSSVQSCCVLAKSDTLGSKQLVGYIVADISTDTLVIEEYLKEQLPEYMVPNIWVLLEEMPVTSNGKIAKKILPSPDLTSLSRKEYLAPQTKLEIELAKIWEELLGIEKIGLNDSFFELGGHSLSATRLVSMMRKELAVEVSIRDIFAHATLIELSTYLTGLPSNNLLPAIVKEEKEEHIVLSFSQERLWFLDQLQGSREYHIPVVLRLKGNLDVNILEQSLRTIVERHEILRTTIYSIDGVGYQKTIPSEDWKIKVEKQISSVDIGEEELEKALIQPFDLSSDYMMRAYLYDLSEDNFVLACVFHHIASDGWSQGILISEFTEIYKALAFNKQIDLPDLKLQYSDYALWQRKYVDGDVLENELSYWENKLKHTPPLALPTDYLRPSIQSTDGATINFKLDKELSDSITQICKKEDVTLFMVLLATFKVLLSRYSGQTDICVGTSIANRTQAEVEGMIGFFVNTLALRSDLSQNPTFKEVLQQVKETTLEGYDHQLAPFEKVVDRVADNRDMSITPVFQTLFTLQNTPVDINEDDELEGIEIAPYSFEENTSQFDLNLTVIEDEEGLLLNMEYCTALFNESTIRRMLTHYKELLVSLVKDNTQNIRSISILTEHEEKELLYDFNNTEVAYPLDKTTVDLFREQVEKTPDSVALIFGNDQLSYRELDEKSNQLARYLKDQGVGEDVLVALCIERSLEMIVGVLGILKAGGAYVPIKPDYPEARISHILSDIKGDIVLTDELSAKSLDVLTDIRIIELESVNSPYLEYSTDSIETNLSPSSLGYVIYTSGSTGVPKGAMIEHSGLLNHLLIMIDELSMTTESVVAFTAPFTFDISVWQMLSGLLSGGKVVIYSEEQILDPSSLQESLYDHNVSHLQLVPSYVSGLLDTSSEKSLEKLSYFLVTGEATQHSLLSRWFSRYPNIPVVNAYGPAEASDDVSLHIMHELPTGSTVPVGKPVANMHIYVVDSSGNLCPKGIVGEIWVSGIGVGRGYVNDLEKTTKSFIANPFIPSLGKVYKTGDLGRWLSDGTLEFVGRSDDQVKIRGYRIELGEIEGVLSSFETVESCCVLAKEDGSGNNRLVGYLVSEGEFNKQEVQEYLKDRLPEYMVPQLWVELEDMPLTNNGKIDKKGLPDPNSISQSSNEHSKPRNSVEEQLVLIWQDLLDVGKVGIYDDFFDLGGHSILAIQLIAQMNDVVSKELSIADLFEYPTIAEISDYSSFDEETIKNDILIALQKEGERQPIFLAPPAGGEASAFLPLTKSLGKNQPLYGFQCSGLDGESLVMTSVEEMASLFIDEMQKIDPHGPYRIGGYSFGGDIACEMVRQLYNKGYKVEELLIFESMAPIEGVIDLSENKVDNALFSEVVLQLVSDISNLFNTTLTIDSSELNNKSKDEQLEVLYNQIKKHPKLAPLEKQIKGRVLVYITNSIIKYVYKDVEKTDVSIVVFKTEEEGLEGDLGWGALTNREVKVFNVSGNHGTMLDEPNTALIAMHINELSKPQYIDV